MSSIDVQTPKVIIGLITGAGLPYYLSAMTMKSVGRAGLRSIGGAARPHGGFGEPDYTTCFKISTNASFRGMIVLGAVVMFTPLIVKIVFHVETLSSVLAGSLGSVVQMGISPSNTDGAWNQAKEDIRVCSCSNCSTASFLSIILPCGGSATY